MSARPTAPPSTRRWERCARAGSSRASRARHRSDVAFEVLDPPRRPRDIATRAWRTRRRQHTRSAIGADDGRQHTLVQSDHAVAATRMRHEKHHQPIAVMHHRNALHARFGGAEPPAREAHVHGALRARPSRPTPPAPARRVRCRPDPARAGRRRRSRRRRVGRLGQLRKRERHDDRGRAADGLRTASAAARGSRRAETRERRITGTALLVVGVPWEARAAASASTAVAARSEAPGPPSACTTRPVRRGRRRRTLVAQESQGFVAHACRP